MIWSSAGQDVHSGLKEEPSGRMVCQALFARPCPALLGQPVKDGREIAVIMTRLTLILHFFPFAVPVPRPVAWLSPLKPGVVPTGR